MEDGKIASLKTLEVVFKVAERCNINCTYCYFFNAEDDGYKYNPATISQETVESFADMLRVARDELGLQTAIIDIHGGEPLLMKKARFEAMCDTLIALRNTGLSIELRLQTNAMLVDEGWIEVFSKYDIGIGVSLDGPRAVNDKYRLDHSGNGTYERTMAGIEILQKAVSEGRISPIGGLAVVDFAASPEEVFDELAIKAGIKNFDVLLPDRTHDSLSQNEEEIASDFLRRIYKRWVTHADPDLRIRTVATVLNELTWESDGLRADGEFWKNYQAITVSSAGEMGPDDILKVVPMPLFKRNQFNVSNRSLKDFLNSKLMLGLRTESKSLPSDCEGCCWRNVCKGGDLYHRYSRANGFKEKSVYCKAHKDLYSTVATNLLSSGKRYEVILRSIGLE